MSVPDTVRTANGPWDLIFERVDTGAKMGFLNREPAARRQITNVAPRIRTGGDAAYSSEAWEQFVLNGFDTGGDRLLFQSGDRRYQWSDGKVALAIPDLVTLASQWASQDTGHTATAKQILDFNPTTGNPRIVSGTGTHLRTYNTTSQVWESAQPAAGTPFAANVKHLYANDLYCFIALGTSGSYRWDNSGVNSGFTSLAVNADCFGWYHEVLYRGLGATLFKATANDGSAWSATTYPVGYAGTSILDMYQGANLLFLTKPEGLYAWDGTTVQLMLDFKDVMSTSNGVYGCEWHGAIYFPEVNQPFKMGVAGGRPSAVTEITPKMKGDANKERYGHGAPVRSFAVPGYLITAFDDGEGVYPEVLAYTEVGWHQLYRGTSGETMRAAGFSRLQDWILINVDGATYRKRITNAYNAEYPDYATSGQFTTPAIDAGYPDELKAFRSVSQIVSGCDTNNTIAVEYRLDGGTWTSVGTINSTPTTPDTPIELLLGSANAVIIGRRLELRYTLTRNAGDPTATPKMKMPIIVRCKVRTRPFDGFGESLLIDLTAKLEHGYGTVGNNAGYTIQQMLDFLENARAAASTIIYTDEWNRRRLVNITDFSLDPRRVAGKKLNREKLVAGVRLEELATVKQATVGTISTLTATAFAIVMATQAGIGREYIGASNIGE